MQEPSTSAGVAAHHVAVGGRPAACERVECPRDVAALRATSDGAAPPHGHRGATDAPPHLVLGLAGRPGGARHQAAADESAIGASATGIVRRPSAAAA